MRRNSLTWLPPRPLRPATPTRMASLAPSTRPEDLVPAMVMLAAAASVLFRKRRRFRVMVIPFAKKPGRRARRRVMLLYPERRQNKKKKYWENAFRPATKSLFSGEPGRIGRLRFPAKTSHLMGRSIMRKTMGALLAGVLLLGSGALLRSGEGEDGRAIVAKAIKAAGGADNLAKHKSATFKGKGTYYGMGKGLPYSGNYAFQ